MSVGDIAGLIAAIAFVLLVTLGPYGISMVSYSGEELSNLSRVASGFAA